ncbi:zinc-binding dehydrogenase [Actinoallomurus spadix]|uniref:NADP-dependent oxidoreductase n=1 Tax=Actinoallomurus spadix TaxID=79912 RepID=A0ABN0WUK0_9ACTN|nr:zinc-binding dehydrogenase [Actinoallomurus spadix]MCO5986454.1 zinc-binding dehydrogenase [Actinoallomurus spadix]
MRAIGIAHFGETPALREVPVPEPGGGEVRVAIEAASINPLDLAIASGALAALGGYRFPLTLGMDGALPTAGMTALGAIDVMGVPEGGTLVVLGATGGVGTFTIQAAAARGIRVIATASARLAEEVRRLGATEIVVRGAEPLDEALRRLAPEGVDAILDAVGDRSLTSSVAGAVRDGGALLSIGSGLEERLLADERIRAADYRLDRKPERLAELTALVTAGTIRPVIGARLPPGGGTARPHRRYQGHRNARQDRPPGALTSGRCR